MKKQLGWVIALAAILIVGFVLFSRTEDKDESKVTPSPKTQNSSNNQGSTSQGSAGTGPDDGQPVEEQEIAEHRNALSGVLRTSNDKSRGNLMLEVDDSDRIVYLTTSKDYSSLVGKSVKVDIEGDVNSFSIINISED